MMRSMQRQMPQQYGPMRNSQPAAGKGGILSNLFQRNTGTSVGNAAANGFSRAGTNTSLIQSLANPQKISSFLNQTQQVLNTAQKFGPVVQQYGPMVKNLPSMWKLYRAFKDNPMETEETEKPVETKIIENDLQENSTNKIKTIKPPPKDKQGKSVPKLYIS